MASQKISDMSAAAAIDAGANAIKAAIVQGGANVYATETQLKTYCNALAGIGPIVWPQQFMDYDLISFTGGVNSVTLNATTDVLAWCGTYTGAADSIVTVAFHVGAIAATAGVGVVVQVKTVVNGRPSGTLWNLNGTGANPKGSVTIADTDDSAFKTATLTNAANLVAGDEFAIVIRYEAGHDDGTFAVLFEQGIQNASGGYPAALFSDGGAAFTLQSNMWSWIVTMISQGIISLPGLYSSAGAATIVSVNNSAAADERALRFQVAAKMRVIGARALMCNVAAGANFQYVLWSTGTQVGQELAQTNTIDGDLMISATADGWVEAMFTAPFTLEKNTTYYLGVKSLAAANAGLAQINFAAAGDKAGAFLGPTFAQCQLAFRTWDESATPDTAGAWTEGAPEALILPVIALIIDQVIA